MKKPILLLILLLSLATSSNGQEGKFEIGVFGGMGWTNFDGSDFFQQSLEPEVNLYSEFSFQYHWSQHFSIRSGIAYNQKGAVTVVSVTDIQGEPLGDHETHYNLDYISLPILLQYTLGNTFKYYAIAGGYFSHLIHQETVIGAIGPFSEMKSNEIDNYRLWDVGLSAGLGCSYPITDQWKISLEGRLSHGLNDILDGQINNEKYLQNQAFHVLLGLSYRFQTVSG